MPGPFAGVGGGGAGRPYSDPTSPAAEITLHTSSTRGGGEYVTRVMPASPHWKKYTDANGKAYYHNEQTNET